MAQGSARRERLTNPYSAKRTCPLCGRTYNLRSEREALDQLCKRHDREPDWDWWDYLNCHRDEDLDLPDPTE